MTDEMSEHAVETPMKDKTGGEAAKADPKPEGVGPVDKKPEIEQQPT